MRLSDRIKKLVSKLPLGKKEKNYKKLTPRRLKKRILITLGIFFAFIVILFVWYSKDLPTPGKIQNRYPVESSKIMDRNGNTLYDVHGEQKRTVIDKQDIPEEVKQATVSAEDKNFYKHFGIDFTSIVRAVFVDIFKGGYAQGGSTITQQFVKNALLSPKKTIDRKIKELILSLEIEIMYSKDDILTFYLNEIPYGSNAYGIEAASQTYYDKPAKELTLDQAAMLAALPKAPTYYSPYGQNPEKLKERRDYVLGRMKEDGHITEEKMEKAKKQKIEVAEQKENITAPHFVMYVKQKLVEMYGEKMVEEGGLKVTTTLDLDKQKIAEEAVMHGYEKNISQFGANNAALVSLDPKTGQILAMVGSHDYFDTDRDGQVNVTISERQPGSSFKPIAYATAFKGEYSPASTLWDVRTDFGNYSPENYDQTTRGPVSIRYALANSLNIPAVKILYLAGLDNVLNTAHEMGITTLNDPERYGLSLVLGGGEVKPLDMATAFGVFADNGTLAETIPFLKIEDHKGKVLEEYQESKHKKEVLYPQIAYQISDILSDNAARSATFGSNSPLNFGNRPVAAKTGTTDSFRDAWTNGYTPSISTSVWVGNNDNTPMSGHAAGVLAAAPIFREYMEKVLADTPIEQFEQPEGIKKFTVDKLSGKIPTDESPETVTDIFASWQIPKEYDDIHVKVRVCLACDDDKLADENCPESQVEERVYTNLHSEVPDSPNWENPVRAAAEALGIHITKPPQDVCDINNIKPTVNITSPTNNQEVSGNFDITADASSSFGIRHVEFLIDNVKIGQTDSSPFSYSYDANNLSEGSHKITAKATDNHDLVTSNTITISVTKDTQAPGVAKNVTLKPGSKSMVIGWTNPVDIDLSIARIYISTKSGTLGIKNQEVAASPNAGFSTTITNLNTGIKYYFTIRTVDTSDNENSNITQYKSVPL